MTKEELKHPNRNPNSKRYQKWYQIKMQKKAYIRARDYIWKIKSDPCVDCKKKYHPSQMSFDHIRGIKGQYVKRFTSARSKIVLDKEISQCELVCLNCHALRTWKTKIFTRKGRENVDWSLFKNG